ncbi:MAG TPA: HEAT repeat domain-containing protein [Anaerolineaceae bacterium]
MPAKKTREIPFEMVVRALLDESKMFPPSYLHRFSDISAGELKQLKEIWPEINPARRVALMEDLEELEETDTLVSFRDLSTFALTDSEPMVRIHAIQLLWEYPNPDLVEKFTDLLENDPQPAVRAAAASALGMFVYLGELEEIAQPLHQQVVEALLRVTSGPDQAIVRRRALEALGFSGREEVAQLIQSAFQQGDVDWLQSAVFAMGRSADPRWEEPVLRMLTHEDNNIREEAIRAAGLLELAAAREPLLTMLQNLEEDDDAFETLIWSLSQIGGEGIRDALERIAEDTEDDDVAEFIDSALENLDFTEGFDIVDMFDFNDDPEGYIVDDGDGSEPDESDGENR